MQTALDIMRSLAKRPGAVCSDEPCLHSHKLAPGARCDLRADTELLLCLPALEPGDMADRFGWPHQAPYVSARLTLMDELRTGTVFAKRWLHLVELNLPACQTLVAQSEWFRALFFRSMSLRLRDVSTTTDRLHHWLATCRLH